jgi:hypothetical protein
VDEKALIDLLLKSEIQAAIPSEALEEEESESEEAEGKSSK